MIDYVFTTDWKLMAENPFQITLKNNIDWVFKNFCDQLKTINTEVKNIKDLVEHQKSNDAILREIKKIESAITTKCNQFKKKVELNEKLKELKQKLK